LDVALLRVNHDGTRMDTPEGDGPNKGDRPQVLSQLAKVHAQKTGVIGMKLIGEGRFKTPEERDASIRSVMKLGTVDAVTIGYKSTAEIDEAIQRINTHLNS
jgi:putative N-acetylmannosamine-6-phosphate epimerase